MKIKLLFTSILLLVVGNCFGQITFQKVIYADSVVTGNAVQQTIDGGYIIAGSIAIKNKGANEVYLAKTTSNGDTLWTKIFGGSGDEEAHSVQQTTDGGYIIGGYISDSGYNQHIYVVKTNARGDTLWTKGYGASTDDGLSYIQQVNDSEYVVTGSTTSFGAGGNDVYLIKIDINGDIIWSRTYGGTSDDAGYCVKETSDKGYIICGYASSFSLDGAVDVYLIKTNINGDTLWTKTYGDTNDQWGASVMQTTDSGYIITGSIILVGGGSSNIYLIKTNANGDTLWTKTYGGYGYNFGYAVQQTDDGGYIIVGKTDNFGGDNGAYLIKTKSNGDTLWTKTYGTVGGNVANYVQQTIDSGYIITGLTTGFTTSQEGYGVYLIKTDPNGNSGCNEGSSYTIVGFNATTVSNPHTMVGSGGTASPTNTTIASGGTDSTLCLTTGINEQIINNIISIFPNPTTDQLTITGNWKENGKMKLTIINILGETIYEEAINRKEEIVNCKPFSAGIYFIRVANEKESWVAKFVKD